jgi:hypothetical protein
LNHAGLQFIAERIVVASLETAFLSLPFPGDNQVFQTARALSGGLATFSAPLVTLSAHLVFTLPRDRQMRELIDYKVVGHNKSWSVREQTETPSCRDNK